MNRQAIKILSLALVLATSSSVAFAQKVWKGSWATAVEWTGKGDMPKEGEQPFLSTDSSCFLWWRGTQSEGSAMSRARNR